MRVKRLRYALDARLDLAEIRSYLRKNASAKVAARMLERIRGRVAATREWPLSGVPRPEYHRNCRFAVERPYMIYYLYDGEEMVILRILHAARDRDSVMRGVQEDAAPMEA